MAKHAATGTIFTCKVTG